MAKNLGNGEKLSEQVSSRHKWLKDKWLTEAKKIQELYCGDATDETPFNILYSNTETLVPAIYSQAPAPVVKRRHDESRGNVPAKAAQRFLSYLLDTNLPNYPAYQDAVESAVLDAALPGQGLVRVRLVDKFPVLDYVPYDCFVWGYAKRWEDVPWIAFQHDMTRQDIIDQFKVSPEVAATFPEPEADQSDEKKQAATLPVYEVWDKRSRQITYVADGFPNKIIAVEEDSLKLVGFFPVPKPLCFVVSTTDTLPRPLYRLYRKQAEELNALTTRIKRVTEAIRVRGIFNGNLPELSRMFEDGGLENALLPAEKPSILTNDGGLDRQIWMIPNDKLIVVLQQLFQAREGVKATIYEILGIGDILRGMSKASETLGAQQIKDKWGSLRINKMRAKTGNFIRDGLRLLVEVGAKHSPEEVWAAATGLQLPTAIETAVLQQSGQLVPPDSWPSVLQTLQSDLARSYIIDIESNSTVDSEATQDKQDITEFMTGFGQAMNGLGPLAQSGPEGFQAAKEILIEFCRKFRMGVEVQAILEKLQPPKTAEGPPPQVMEELKKRSEEVAKREQAVQQAEQGLVGQESKLTQLMAKLAMQRKELDMTAKKVEEALTQVQRDKQTASQELELLARDKFLKLREEALNLHEQRTELQKPA